MMDEGTAKEENSTISLTFNMSHCMALAVIEMPKTVYKFTNNGISPYTTSTPVTFITVRPWQKSPGTYRYIYKPNDPNTVINGNYYKNGKSRYFEISQSNLSTNGGAGKIFYVDRNSNEEISDYTLQVGDYLMKDGNLVGKDDLSESQKADVAAIVFSVGHNLYDLSDYSATGIGANQCHGYAVALQDATTSKCQWGVAGTDLGLYPPGSIDNQSNPELDWSGYLYTNKIIEAVKKAGKTLNGNRSDGYPATYYAVESYPKTTAAPANSSGWFLPAVGQLKLVNKNKKDLFTDATVGTALSGEFWSSSEDSDNPNVNALIINGSLKGRYGKSPVDYGLVRAVLAF